MAAAMSPGPELAAAARAREPRARRRACAGRRPWHARRPREPAARKRRGEWKSPSGCPRALNRCSLSSTPKPGATTQHPQVGPVETRRPQPRLRASLRLLPAARPCWPGTWAWHDGIVRASPSSPSTFASAWRADITLVSGGAGNAYPGELNKRTRRPRANREKGTLPAGTGRLTRRVRRGVPAAARRR